MLGFSLLIWFLVIMPPILGVTIYFLQYQKVLRLKREKDESEKELQSAWQLIKMYEFQRQRHISEGGKRDADSDQLFRSELSDFFPEEINLLIVKLDSEGNLLHANAFAKKWFDLTESDSIILIKNKLDRRSQVRLRSALRNKMLPQKADGMQIALTNRFAEILHLNVYLIPENESGCLHAIGFPIATWPGFGNEHTGKLMESLLLQSRWPAILLTKSDNRGNWRHHRVSWISASAARLFGFKALNANGLPMEFLSSGLASFLNKAKNSGLKSMVWEMHGKANSAFKVMMASENSNVLLILCPLEQESVVSEAADPLSFSGLQELPSGSGISFEGLMDITGGDPEFLKILLPSYLNSLREFRVDFRNGIEHNSPGQIRFLHHKMKATIRTFGLEYFDTLFRLALEFTESSGQTPVHVNGAALIADFNSLCSNSEQGILDFAKKHEILV